MKTGSIAERSKQLQIAALSIARGMQAGSFRSSFRGQGIEFDSLREYEYGDDIRSIDWNLMARSGKAFVKMYREERDFRLFILADVSYSMDTVYGSVSTRDTVLETAGLLTFAAEHLHSYTGMVAFDGSIARMLKPQRGMYAGLRLLGALEQAARSASKTKGSALAAALVTAGKVLRQRTLVFILSDFKIEGFEKELGIFARKHDVAALRITAPYDSMLPAAGVLRFKDPETGIERLYPTGSSAFQQDRARRYAESVQQWKTTCIRCGVFPLELSPHENPVKVLNQFFLTGKQGLLTMQRSAAGAV